MTLTSVFDRMRRFLADESAATAIEYALIAALIGIGIIGGVRAVSQANQANFNTVDEALTGE